MTRDGPKSRVRQNKLYFWEGAKKFVYDRDRDWPIKTVGISGLKKNLGQDGGIEEPSWGPGVDKTWAQAHGPAHGLPHGLPCGLPCGPPQKLIFFDKTKN